MCAAFKIVRLLLFVLTSVLATGVAQAQEWCRDARTPIEELICLNPDLADLDARLTQAFAAAQSVNVDQAQLTSQQRQWLKRRNACGNDYDCILVAYETRIKRLERIVRGALSNPLAQSPENGIDSSEVSLPAVVPIPLPRPATEIAFAVPDPDPSCDFATTRSSSCAAYAADTMTRYYQYVRQAMDDSHTATPAETHLTQNVDLCDSDPWCLWRKYSLLSENLYNRAHYAKISIVDPPPQVRSPPLYADGEFTCGNLADQTSKEFRIRLTPWIDEDSNRVLAMHDYGRWNIILVDQNNQSKLKFNDSIAFWWQIRLVEDKSFLDRAWIESRKNAWIVIRHLRGTGTLESIYAFGDTSGRCDTFPDAFEPLRELRMLPREAIDYFYGSLIGDPIDIPSNERSDDLAYDIYLKKMDRLKEFLAEESHTKNEEASRRAKESTTQGKTSSRTTSRSQTLIPSR